MGFPSAVAQRELHHSLHLRRFIKASGGVARPCTATNAFGQGYTYALMHTNALVSIQFRIITAALPGVRPTSFLDDRVLMHRKALVLVQALIIAL